MYIHPCPGVKKPGRAPEIKRDNITGAQWKTNCLSLQEHNFPTPKDDPPGATETQYRSGNQPPKAGDTQTISGQSHQASTTNGGPSLPVSKERTNDSETPAPPPLRGLSSQAPGLKYGDWESPHNAQACRAAQPKQTIRSEAPRNDTCAPKGSSERKPASYPQEATVNNRGGHSGSAQPHTQTNREIQEASPNNEQPCQGIGRDNRYGGVKVVKTATQSLRIAYANLNGARSKLTSIKEIIEDQKPDIFALVETHLKPKQDISIKGYIFKALSRENKGGGGIGILIKKEISYMMNTTQQPTTQFPSEVMWLCVNLRPQVYIGVFYVSKKMHRLKL